jgi:2-keto-4-pentenoate hydratase
MTPVSNRLPENDLLRGSEVSVLSDDAATIAGRFLSARRAAGGLADYPGVFPSTLEDAYRIQDEAIAAWAQPVIGWKVGRILPPLSEQFGTDRLAGPIFAPQTAVANGQEPKMPVFAEGFAAGEAEYLLRIGRTPPRDKRNFTLDEAADLIDAVHVGIEIASSPLGDINKLGPIAVISDFGNNNGLVLGDEIADWRSSGFEGWDVTTLIDSKEVGTGRATSFPDGAIGAARFLFELMARRGIALQPGQWISSGAVTGVHDALPGQLVEARFGEAYSVKCSLEAARPQQA